MENNNYTLKSGELVIKIASVANELDGDGYWTESDQLDSTMYRISGGIDFLAEGKLNELRESVERGDEECGHCGKAALIMHPMHMDIAICPHCQHEVDLAEEAGRAALDGWHPYDV